MRRVCGVCLLAALLWGCSPSVEVPSRAEGEQLISDLIQARHDLAEVIAPITDAETARQVLDDFKEAFTRTRVKAVMVSRLPKDLRFSLQKEHRAELNDALTRMNTELARAEEIPEVSEIILEASTDARIRVNIPQAYQRELLD